MNPTPQAAYTLALWLRANAPRLYMALAHNSVATKIGALGCGCNKGLGDDLTTITVDSGAVSTVPALDTLDPSSLEPITVTDYAPLTIDPALASQPADSSPGLLSQVASFLTTGGGITAALNLATATVASSTQRNVVNAQLARVAGGANPAAISYRINPATGALVPTLSTPQGGVAVTPSLLQKLAPNAGALSVGSFISNNILWIALGLLGVVVLAARR